MMRTVLAMLVAAAVFAGGYWYRSIAHPSPDNEEAGNAWNSPVQGATESSPRPTQRPGIKGPQSASPLTSAAANKLRAQIQDNQTKISNLDQQIQSNRDNTTTDTQDRLADLQQSIQQQQGLVASLESQRQGSQADLTVRQSNQQSLMGQQAALVQQKLTTLQTEIDQQRQQAWIAEQEVRNTIAPDGSDNLVALQDYANEQDDKLKALQNQYNGLLQQQSAIATQAYANENNRIQAQQAGQVDLDVAATQAQSELDRLRQEYQQLSQKPAAGSDNTQALVTQKENLQRETQDLQRRYTQLTGQAPPSSTPSS